MDRSQETQLAILGTVVRALYTVQSIRNVLHYDATQKTLETDGSYYRRYWNTMEGTGTLWNIIRNSMEVDGNL